MAQITRGTGRAAVRGPGRELAVIASAQVLALTTWFAASAAAPAIRSEWHLSGAEVPLLTTAVQVGFVIGALSSALVNLPDRYPAPRVMTIGALGAALCTALFATIAHDVWVAAALRLLTGICLALVYPVGLKLASSWFLDRRGLALGVLVGALTLGSTLPQLVGGSFGDAWRPGLGVAAGLALVAAVLASRTRIGPHVAAPRAFRPGVAVSLLRQRGPRLAHLGYFGHMWELYAVWTWLPAYLTASTAAAGDPISDRARGLIAFVTLGLCGVLGCLVGGRAGDRWGLARTAAAAMVTSGLCCLLAAALYGGPLWLLLPLLAVWGAAVIADSALFSAATTRVVDPQWTGTALTFQTAVGFLITVVTIQGVPLVQEATSWPAAIALLGIGPLLGAVAMLRLSPVLGRTTG
jgi:MFS family permease